MLTFTDYALENVPGLREYQKKKDEEEKKKKLFGDIAPVASTYLTGGVSNSGTLPYAAAPQPEISAPVRNDGYKWYEGYLKKGAFEDGRQHGDTGKAIVGTSTDLAKNLLTGAASVVEGFADFGAGLAPLMMEQQLIAEGGRYSEAEKELYQQSLQAARKANAAFIQADTVNEEAVAKNLIAGGYAVANPLKLLWGNGRAAAGVGDVIKERYQKAMGYMTDEIKDGEVIAPSQMEQNSFLDKKADALIQSAGQMAVQMGMQAAGVPWWLTAGVTASAAETEAALKEGATLEQATASGMITAGAEVLTEQIGGIKFGGKGLDDVVAKALSRAITDRFWRTAAKVGLDVFSEGIEEVLTEGIGEFGQWLTYRSQEELKELLFSEEAMQAKIDAFVGGGLMGGGFGTINAVRAGNKGIDYASGMTSNEKAVVDKVYRDAVKTEKAAAEDGKVSGKRKREIYDEVLKQLEKGEFSVETIEEVLGGEAYQSYRQADADRAKLQAEYDELYGMKNSEKSNKQIDREAYLKGKLEDEKANAKREELKKTYTDNVLGMALKDRLGESYRQRDMRGRAYEADVSQYTGKAKETVQKAMDSGILNNTTRTHDFVDLIAKISEEKGVTFDFTNNQRLKESGFAIAGRTVNGYVTSNGVTLNIESPKALNQVVGHEVMHVLQEAGLTDALTEKLFAYAESKGELASRREAVEALYEGRDANIDEELAAELVGDYLFSNKDFISQLSTENRNVFQKVWDEIKYLCKVATAGSKEGRELARIEKMFGEVYRESGEAKNTTREGGVKLSLSFTPSEIQNIQNIGRKSVNAFNSSDIAKTEKFAQRYWGEMGTKSPFYRAWFGDWRKNDQTPVQIARQKGDTRGVQHNEDTGWDIHVSGKVFNESKHKGPKNQTALPYLPYINDIVSKAVLLDSYGIGVGKEKSSNSLLMHSLYAVADIGNGPEILKLYVEEMNDPNAAETAKRAYQLQNIEKQQLGVQGSGNIPSPIRPAATIANVADLFALVKRMDNNFVPNESSKIVNADGTPKVVFHGTNAAFNTFQSKSGEYWFSEYEDYAESMMEERGGGEVKAVYLNMRNPYRAKLPPGKFSDPGYEAGILRDAKAKGHDGVIIENDTINPIEAETFYVVFDSTQIKSATDNIGTFDGSNPDIRYSVSSDDLAPVGKVGEVYGRDIGIEAPVREDLYGNVPEEFLTETDEAFDAMLDEIEIRDTRQRLDAIREHSQQELEANQQYRQEAKERYDQKIAKAQQQYDAKKNKESKLAQDLLKRIERLKRLQADVDAGYSKRISDIQRRLKKTDLELEKDHSRKDSYQQAIARIDRNLEQDKAALEEEYRVEMEAFGDKNGWISNRATELYQELRHLKEGKRASGELSYLLDLRQERGWSWDSLRAALVNVRHTPGQSVNQYSVAEQAVREMLDGAFETDQEAAELEYEEKLADLEAEAEDKRTAARTSNQAKVKHEEHWEEVKDMVGDTSTWVDKPLGLQYSTSTLQRNIQDVVRGADGKTDYAKAKAIYEYLGGSYNHNEAQLKQEDNAIKKWYQDQKITQEESVYIQMLGEFLYNPETELSLDVVEEYLAEHKKAIDEVKVDRVIEQARKDYDALFERLNTVLRENGMKEIPYRKGYFPHLKLEGEQSLLAKVLKWKTQDNKLPTDIAGLTEDFNPPRSYQAFNKQRTGDTTEYDFRKGLDAYVHGALDWIYHIEDIQRRREFENYIRYIHSKEGIKAQIEEVFKDPFLNADEVQAKIEEILKKGQNPLGNFVTDLRTQTNLLAAKKHSMDRGMEQMLNRDVYSVASNISNRVSANMVAGSLSAAMSNFIPITQSWGEVNPRFTLQAAADVVRAIREDDGMVEKSDFLTNRLLEEQKLDRGFWDNVGDAVGFLMTGADHVVSQTVWRSKYRQNLSEGMSEADAIQNADLFAERLMAGRSRGNQPTLFESKNLATKMLTAFQLEVNNQYQYLFKDLPREMRNEAKGKLVTAYGRIFIGAYLYNALSTVVTGRQQAFDPIRIFMDLFGGIADEEEDDSEDITAFATDLLEQTPFVGGLIGGGRVPISSALPYDGNPLEAITGVAQAWETKDWKRVWSELQNPIWYLLPPMAGGQIRKAVQGLSMFPEVAKLWGEDLPVAGSYTDSGALRYTVDENLGNVLQAALFGQWANQNAQQYIEEGRAPLQEKQMAEFLALDIPIEDYWAIRDGLKGLKTVNEKADYIASLDLSTKQKNLLINNIADRKNPIDMSGYGKYADFEEMDFAVKNPELYKWLQSQGMTMQDYNASGSAKKEAYSWAAKNPEKYAVSRAVTDNLVQYRTYTSAINKMEANKDADGKTISGSRKKKVVAYINSLDLDYGAKIILYRMEYQSDDSYNYEIVEYLNSLKELSYSDMKTILEELGMVVDKEGNVTW